MKLQVLVVKAEVGQRRNRDHRESIDRAVRFQGKGHKSIGDGVYAPVGLEGIVLPVLQLAHHFRRVVKAEYEVSVFHANRGRAVPGVPVDPRVPFQWERRMRSGVARGVLPLLDCGGVFLLQVYRGFEGCNPVRGRQLEVMIEQVVENRFERRILLRVGQNDDAEIVPRHQHDARYESVKSSGVSHQLAAMIVAHHPA